MKWHIVVPLFVMSVHFLFTLLAIVRKRYFKNAIKKEASDFTPSLNVFVPCKGWNKDLNTYLRSVLNQNYHNYKVIFITESEKDQANIEIAKLLKEYDNAYHVISGITETCGQKNHNLLKAIEKYSDCDIFVFCDSDLLFEKYWLSDLVKPFKNKQISFSSSFYSVEAQKNKGLTSTFYSGFSFYSLMMLFGTGSVWGGSMAIRKSSFEKSEIAELWKKAVVDDVSLSKLVKKINEKVFVVYPNGLKSIMGDGTSFRNVFKWCKRQIMYIKYYLRIYWLLSLFIYIPITLSMMSLPVLLVVSFLKNSVMPELLAYSIVFIMVMLNNILVILMNEEKLTIRQFIYVLPVFMVVSYSFILTVFTNKLHWAGYIYKMKFNGEVKSIELA
ncbi:glycosyltransferase [Candidatus Poribacteria bacterium]